MKREALIERVRKVKEILDRYFPEAYKPRRTPLEQAVFTVLSQNTTDRQAERCLENLKELTENRLLLIKDLTEEKVIEAIKPCGMYNKKYRALKSLLSDWKELEEKLSVLPEREAIEFLKSYPFIGSKTARVILTFGFGKNTFPIDTNCRRVLNRLGIFPKDWSLDEISEFMEENFSAEFNRKFHYDLIRVGRKFCKPKKPKCEECPLRRVCSYQTQTLSSKTLF
jgi:endonuclease-3